MRKMNIPGLASARFDANETVFLARELESIDPTNYMSLYAGLRGRQLIPLAPNVDPLSLTYTWRRWEVTGRAKVGAPHANDEGIVQVFRTEASTPIKKIPVSYGWGVDEIRQAARAGVALDQVTVQAAMSVVARKVDSMLAFGEPGTQITGLLNNTTVDDSTTPVTKTGSGTAWTVAATPSELLADLNLIIADTRAALKQASFAQGGEGTPAFDRFVIAVPSFHYGLLMNPRSSTSDTSVLELALKNNRHIESIEEWWQLDTADGGNPMIVCYPRDEMCVAGIIPREFESLDPQAEGHEIMIPASGTCGGTVIRYSVAVRYLKGV